MLVEGFGWSLPTEADLLIASDRVDDATRLFTVTPDQDAVARTGYPYPTRDNRSAARIAPNGAAATPLGNGPANEALDAVFTRATTAVCAEALGAMETAVDATVGYLKTRKEFGVTLQRCQALTLRPPTCTCRSNSSAACCSSPPCRCCQSRSIR